MKLQLVKIGVIILGLFLLSNISYSQDCSHDENQFNCLEYVRNPDGDTIYVNIPNIHSLLGEGIAIRIQGIDTGEIKNYEGRGQCEYEMAILAKNELEKLLMRARSIKIKNIQRGKYFRILADVYLGKRNLGKLLLEKGLAYEYFGGPRGGVDWCELQKKVRL